MRLFYFSTMENISTKQLHQLFLKHPIISKDSRTIPEGCIYFALKGEHFDGNRFAKEALEKGAAFAVVDDRTLNPHPSFLLVEDSLKCLQALGNYHRSQFNIPVIGITGSNGKTSTKELIYSVLSKKYKTLATSGNYNNHIGVPLTLLEIKESHEMAIIEMGASAQGEIKFLCEIANPNYGLITNIGKAHLEGFGGIEGVKKGKSELYRHIEKHGGKIFINKDDEVLVELAGSAKQLEYGSREGTFCKGEMISSQPTVKGNWWCNQQVGSIDSQLYGAYNFNNIMAAVAVGNYFDVEAKLIDQGVNTYVSDMNRSQIVKRENYTVYLDAYNANPTSMKVALDNFIASDYAHKYVILGDMFEIGESSTKEHKKIIEQVLESKEITEAIFVGKEFNRASKSHSKAQFFLELEEAKKWFSRQTCNNAGILIKGSRGMQLEKLLN